MRARSRTRVPECRSSSSLLGVTSTSPLTNRIGQVFIPVRDIESAATWYSALLGLPVTDTTHENRIYDLPGAGGVGIALDAHHQDFTADGPPRFTWRVDDLTAVRGHLHSLGIDLSLNITNVGSVDILQFRDPDGNLLMVSGPGEHATGSP
jgi:predicted enzyme related to lactoylglutathione lyase